MSGQLFTHYFLTDGIRATPEWQASAADPQAFTAFRESVLQRYEALARSAEPNEAVTEQDLIRPVLELLGWADYLPQQRAAGNEDIPDHLLFADAGSKERASAERKAAARARYAIALEESKRFGLSLDERDREAGFHARSPHRPDPPLPGPPPRSSRTAALRWGLLTNGRVWRLYDYRARPRASGYFEADLADLLEPGREEVLRVFHLLFRRAVVHAPGRRRRVLPRGGPGRGPPLRGAGRPGSVGGGLRACLPGARQGPRRRGGKGRCIGASLPEVHKAALIFLYRLLFVLLRRGPWVAARQRLPLRRLRTAQAGARRCRPQDGGE